MNDQPVEAARLRHKHGVAFVVLFSGQLNLKKQWLIREQREVKLSLVSPKNHRSLKLDESDGFLVVFNSVMFKSN